MHPNLKNVKLNILDGIQSPKDFDESKTNHGLKSVVKRKGLFDFAKKYDLNPE